MFGKHINKIIYAKTEKLRELRLENERANYELAKAKDRIATLYENIDYLVKKGVLKESLAIAMKFDINLRDENFLASKEEIDRYFTE